MWGATGKPIGASDMSLRADDVSVVLSWETATLSLPFRSASEKGAVVPKAVVEVRRNDGDSLEVIASALVARLEPVSVKRSGEASGWYSRT